MPSAMRVNHGMRYCNGGKACCNAQVDTPVQISSQLVCSNLQPTGGRYPQSRMQRSQTGSRSSKTSMPWLCASMVREYQKCSTFFRTFRRSAGLRTAPLRNVILKWSIPPSYTTSVLCQCGGCCVNVLRGGRATSRPGSMTRGRSVV
jgi:hypothetical protein